MEEFRKMFSAERLIEKFGSDEIDNVPSGVSCQESLDFQESAVFVSLERGRVDVHEPPFCR